jgi:hypothetical protein
VTEQAVAVAGEAVTVPAGFRPCGHLLYQSHSLITHMERVPCHMETGSMVEPTFGEDVMKLPAAALAVVTRGFPSR